jgi:hypothetical protein
MADLEPVIDLVEPCDGIHAMTNPLIEAIDVVKVLGSGAGQVQALPSRAQ